MSPHSVLAEADEALRRIRHTWGTTHEVTLLVERLMAALRVPAQEVPLREVAQRVVDSYEAQVRGAPLEAPYLGDAIRALRSILERA